MASESGRDHGTRVLKARGRRLRGSHGSVSSTVIIFSKRKHSPCFLSHLAFPWLVDGHSLPCHMLSPLRACMSPHFPRL